MALLKGLLRALIERGEIQTTEARAKDVRSIAEKVITM
ncbi:MAG: L17 family ribosomal protein, partial [Armatimonadota bacterium]|nr:L17 family ribosomal protein [Armatimonadota bacterium]